jgi:hypothetical protein
VVVRAGLPDDIAVAAPIASRDDVFGLVIIWKHDDLSSDEAERLGRRAELVGRALGALLELPAAQSPAIPLRSGSRASIAS